MNFDRRYWFFIALAIAFAIIAAACTLYLRGVSARFMECDSVAVFCFSKIGMVPTMAFGILALLPVMVAIPYLLRQNQRLGCVSVLLLSCIVAYTFFDAINDVSAIFGYHNSYMIAHAVLSATNNVAGTTVGTGPSFC